MWRPRRYFSTKIHKKIDDFGKTKCGNSGRKTFNLNDVNCLKCLKWSTLTPRQKARLEARIMFQQEKRKKS